MGELISISRNFSAAGSEGLASGVRLRNAELLRKMPWGDDWQRLKISILFNVETFGIVRSGARPISEFCVGVCSGPWGIGDPHLRTWRAVGLNFNSYAVGGLDAEGGWAQTVVGGQSTWNSASSTRGDHYYVYSSAGSYATGGSAQTRNAVLYAVINNGGIFGYPDSTGLPRRTFVNVVIQRQPYGTAWSLGQYGPASGGANLALDTPNLTYLAALSAQTAASVDTWYSLASANWAATQTFTGATPDIRNSPMDFVDLYWGDYTMGLDVWRFDVRKLA